MAKRKKKRKSSLGANLKYEVYGILLITLSVIALSGEATVGRSLSKLFGLALGKFYFVLALVGIYVGLAVMIKRTWPSGWSNRKSGFLLLVLALTLYSSIAVMDKKTEPTGGLDASYILQELGSDIRETLLSPAPTPGSVEQVAGKPVSGGYIGAFQYTLLYLLFGYFGSKFVMIVMFAISFMLMTGKSYVELAGTLKRRGGRLLSLLHARMTAGSRRSLAASSAVKAVSKSSGRPIVNDDRLLDDDDEDYEQPSKPRTKAKKLPFFSWFNDAAVQEGHPSSRDGEWLLDDDEQLPAQTGKDKRRSNQWIEDEEAGEDDWRAYPAVEEVGAVNPGSERERLPWEEEEPSEVPPIREEGSLPDSDDDDYIDMPPKQVMKDEQENELDKPAASTAITSPAFEQADGDAAASSSPIASQLAEVKPYQLPPMSLLAKPVSSGKSGDGADAVDSRRKLEATLESFGVRAKVLDVVRGPAVTRYEVQPATGVKVSRIVGLTDDIALALAAKDIRMEAPIPGKSAIGIEVPNTEVSMVTMREVMETPSFLNATSKVSIAFGRDISGQTIVGNLARMPHLLVAGATGSGKSVCINGIITSILYKARPDEVKFLMIDPKMVELNVYNGIPHLLAPVVTDPKRASLALKKIVVEMEKRYELFSKSGTRNIEGYNTLVADNPAAVLPFIVVIVDELADLMMVAANDVEDAICRLAQMARAAGIHLIIATQRPSVDVITGVIKANIPSRIAFGVSSQVDSRTILDSAGAEKLLGRGDMLFLPVGMSKPIRVQGAFLSDHEVEAVVAFSRGQGEAEYKEDLVPELDEASDEEHEMQDELFEQAVRIVLEAKQASVSLLQRRMRIGYNRAARLIDQMEARSIIGPYEGSKPREVLLTVDQYDAGKISS
ncbi:FtsK/SpoIIIE family DNA translocase [Paenibacillus mendelii]|uniref:DNA translocase FtsK 4TM domain-containing protein n=1 Tax=Paenibacillus mendelii TaxID=206163 RepID=A0ABV6JGE7_9BACL|nr:DNA translocase FtsK [Paenibacillus mendelii]MCQ6557856.1 DNA translocase FtsK [Paenibacillus mendelii]